jgi:ketosteroid isomerase-like protein
MSRHVIALTALTVMLVGCGDGTVLDPEPADGARGAPGAVEARSAAAPAGAASYHSAQLGRLYELQAAFHGALNTGDADAVRALWAEDATVMAMGSTFNGRDEIVAFFSGSGLFVNGWASLAPAYKTHFDVHGGTADYRFECVYLVESANLTGQTVAAHLNATGTMRKVGDRWLFQTFVAGAGSL